MLDEQRETAIFLRNVQSLQKKIIVYPGERKIIQSFFILGVARNCVILFLHKKKICFKYVYFYMVVGKNQMFQISFYASPGHRCVLTPTGTIEHCNVWISNNKLSIYS